MRTSRISLNKLVCSLLILLQPFVHARSLEQQTEDDPSQADTNSSSAVALPQNPVNTDLSFSAEAKGYSFTVYNSTIKPDAVLIDNAVIRGFISDTLDNIYTQDKLECEQKCISDASCVIWSFAKNDKRCILRGNEEAILNTNADYDSGITLLSKRGLSISFFIRKLLDNKNKRGLGTIDYGTIIQYSNINYPSNSTWVEGKVGNTEECNLACLYEPQCFAWSFNIRNYMCYFKSEYANNFIKNKNYNSGLLDAKPDSTYYPNTERNYECSYFDGWQCIESNYGEEFEKDSERGIQIYEETCRVTDGVTYETGEVLFSKQVKSARDCCFECSDDYDCESWTYDKNTKTCVGNWNIPENLKSEGKAGGEFDR